MTLHQQRKKHQQRKSLKVSDKSKDHWDEILESVSLDFIPIEYISAVVVTFEDGAEWEIEIDKQSKDLGNLDELLQDFFDEYDETIVNVDFRIDVELLKKDITKRTKIFLKHNR